MKIRFIIPWLVFINIPYIFADEHLGHSVFLHHGNVLLRQKKYDEAIETYKKALEVEPHSGETHLNIAIAFKEKGNFPEALIELEYALMYNPLCSKAYEQMADILYKQKKLDEAIEIYNKALAITNNSYDGHLNSARIHNELHQFDKAIEHLELLAKLQPNDVTPSFELANTYNMANKTEKALHLYFRLLDKYPGNPSISYNIAYTLKKLCKVKEAMPYYQATLAKKPDHAEAHFSLGLAYLTTGNFEEGWKEYEWRWKRSSQPSTPRSYEQPLWNGSDLHGKTIFLYAEQGLGDTLQFIRLAKIAKEKGGNVIVGVQRPLMQLLTLCPYIDEVVSMHDTPRHFDVYAPLMSVPYILHLNEETIPCHIPYLYADESLVTHWRNELKKDSTFKIGLCWQGNSNYSTSFLRAVVAAKSITLQQLLQSLGTIQGISFYSLQQETGVDQLKNCPHITLLHTFDENFDQQNGRFMDTAAVMKNLDLVITIDTSIAHLAGGLGVPVWVLLPNPPDWRWMLDRTDTPWYSTMRLFRQPEQGDWESVLVAIAQELPSFIANKNAQTMPKKYTTQLTTKECSHIQEHNLTQQLAAELENITAKLHMLAITIKNSCDNQQQFIDAIKSYALLHDMKTVLESKIAALKNVAL